VGVEVMLSVGFNTELPEKRWTRKPLVNPDFSMEASLTSTEKEILKLVAVGETNTAIGRELSLNSEAIAAAMRKIFRKIDAPNRLQAMLWAGNNL